ncbi:MAG: hypothetical protein WAL61_02105 [Acidimicrobiales bacterium]
MAAALSHLVAGAGLLCRHEGPGGRVMAAMEDGGFEALLADRPRELDPTILGA